MVQRSNRGSVRSRRVENLGSHPFTFDSRWKFHDPARKWCAEACDRSSRFEVREQKELFALARDFLLHGAWIGTWTFRRSGAVRSDSCSAGFTTGLGRVHGAGYEQPRGGVWFCQCDVQSFHGVVGTESCRFTDLLWSLAEADRFWRGLRDTRSFF